MADIVATNAHQLVFPVVGSISMRLICPNCDAEYEVDASAIPDTGRDVQCSNCGHAWFQLSTRVEEDLAAEQALFDPPPAQTANDDRAAEPPARALDESVLAVLREEAEREKLARRNEAPPPIETQTDLGLTEAIAATVAAAAAPQSSAEMAEPDAVAQRIARMKGEEPAPAKPQSRREMLPEIDEINTTLRASTERRAGDAGAVSDGLPGAAGKSAFRSGFVLSVVIGAVVVALYVMAPRLAQQIPGLEGVLTGYVAAIDGARLWLDGAMKAAIGMMRGDGAS
jgi:predicted Zn finger-like uncharacterized protein